MNDVSLCEASRLSVSADGRVTIPAQLRREAGIQRGSALVCYVENGRVVFEDRGHFLAGVQDEVLAAEAAAGHTGSVIEELDVDIPMRLIRCVPTPPADMPGTRRCVRFWWA